LPHLSTRGAAITGDFLTYWKQKFDREETVDLRVRHVRDAAGILKLAFYMHDKSDQYPDQRSKGFLWFLSFYLKLAAAQKKNPTRRRILLIDEPGSYLHARAQRDVLHLLEGPDCKARPSSLFDAQPILDTVRPATSSADTESNTEPAGATTSW